jgi:DNA processing protein
MLDFAGDAGALLALTAAPSVALLGGRKASDYGREMARALARGLAAAGVTVLAGLYRPIGRAALDGVLDIGGEAVAVLGDGLDARRPRAGPSASWPAGCTISEHAAGASGRGWGAPAAERILVGIADVAVLVEAPEDRNDLAAVRIAASIGKPLGAVPGTITSPLSAGPNAALQGGARLIRGPEDVLEMIYEATSRPPRPPSPSSLADSRCGPRLRGVLDQVGAGADTIERLDGLPREVLASLGELEALGLVRRTRSGRYVRRDPVQAIQARP